MVKFFDQKEDVIDLQLTQYGKHLLSQGKMRPAYYAFFDQDILYDSKYGTGKEAQNDAQKRIKTETPRLQTQYVFHGIETEIKQANQQILDGKIDLFNKKIQPTAEKAYALGMPLGTMDINAIKEPSWKVTFYKAPISSSTDTYSGSARQLLHIPQLQTEYNLTVGVEEGFPTPLNPNDSANALEFNEDRISSGISEEYDDGSYYTGKHKYLFVGVEEENVTFLRENYDIEVFEIEPVFDGNHKKVDEILKPLSFFKPPGIEGFVPDSQLKLAYPELDSTYVEYYFDILLDEEIPDEAFCDARVLHSDKKLQLFSDVKLDINCNDLLPLGTPLAQELYNTPSPEEDC